MLFELALVLLRTQAWNALLSAGGQRLVLRAQAWNAHLWLRRLREVFACSSFASFWLPAEGWKIDFFYRLRALAPCRHLSQASFRDVGAGLRSC